MCGIVGFLQYNQAINRSELVQCRDRLTYRGPDDSGVWVSPDQRVGLAHRRLSVVDLTAYGHQPMLSQDQRCCLVFNGEIYNYQELRSELEKLGCCFLGSGDTEVLLAAYQQWGDDCVKRLNGMFAFAIYDVGERGDKSPSVFLARDRAGKKPLYYSYNNQMVSFASELKGLPGGRSLNIDALNDYLALGYIPHNRCIADGVAKLPAGHAMRVNLDDLSMKVWRYWRLPRHEPQAGVNGEELADHVEELLLDAVRLRLRCDVPSGVLLSGGLDSGLLLAAAAKVSSKQVKTFTIGIPGSDLDESSSARRVAEYFATDHHELPLSVSSLEVMEDIAPFIDEPIADSSFIPSWIVSKLTSDHVTVALGGDGGDELFGGYDDYTTALCDYSLLGKFPVRVLSMLAYCAGYLPAGVKGRNRLSSLKGGGFQQLIWGTPYFDRALRRRLLSHEALMELKCLDAPELFQLDLFMQGSDAIDSMTRTHFGSILPDDFLVKVDRSSMYHSLEMRSPLLDYRLVEFAFSSIPSHWKVVKNESRRVQRILARRWLPSTVDYSRKQGFSVPVDEWLRNDQCNWLRGQLESLPSAINVRAVESLIAGHLRGRANGSRLFALLMLAISARNNGWG